MFELFVLLFVFYVGWILGQLFQLAQLRKNIKTVISILENDNITIPEQSQQPIVLLNVEEVDNIILIYDRLTNEFICQATTIEEAAEKFNQLRINVAGSLTHNDNALFFIDGKITK